MPTSFRDAMLSPRWGQPATSEVDPIDDVRKQLAAVRGDKGLVEELGTGVVEGLYQIPSMGGGLVKLAGGLTGSETLKEVGQDISNYFDEQAKPYAGDVQSLADAKGFRDYAKLAAHGVGTVLPTVAATVLSGGLGGAGAVAARLGTGVLSRFATREALAAAIEAGALTASEMAAVNAAKTAGQIAGMAASSYGMEGGSIAADSPEGKEFGTKEAMRAAAAAVPAAAMDVIPEMRFVSRLPGFKQLQRITGKVATGNFLTRGLKEGATQGVIEGGTEGVQTAIEQKGAGKPLNFNEIATAGFIGGVSGGLMGGVAGMVAKPDVKTETQTAVEAARQALSQHAANPDQSLSEIYNQIVAPLEPTATQPPPTPPPSASAVPASVTADVQHVEPASYQMINPETGEVETVLNTPESMAMAREMGYSLTEDSDVSSAATAEPQGVATAPAEVTTQTPAVTTGENANGKFWGVTAEGVGSTTYQHSDTGTYSRETFESGARSDSVLGADGEWYDSKDRAVNKGGIVTEDGDVVPVWNGTESERDFVAETSALAETVDSLDQYRKLRNVVGRLVRGEITLEQAKAERTTDVETEPQGDIAAGSDGQTGVVPGVQSETGTETVPDAVLSDVDGQTGEDLSTMQSPDEPVGIQPGGSYTPVPENPNIQVRREIRDEIGDVIALGDVKNRETIAVAQVNADGTLGEFLREPEKPEERAAATRWFKNALEGKEERGDAGGSQQGETQVGDKGKKVTRKQRVADFKKKYGYDEAPGGDTRFSRTGTKDMLRPAIMRAGVVKVAPAGKTHYDVNTIVKAAPRNAEDKFLVGFVTPDGEMLSRQESLAWLKENRPDVYKALDATTRKNGLESQAYAHAEGLTNDESSLADAFLKQQFGTAAFMYSRGKGTGVAKADIEKALKAVKAKLNIPVVVVETASDIPNLDNPGFDFNGVYHEGKIYLVSSQLESVEEAQAVLLDHELRHAGLRAMMGRTFDGFLGRAWADKGVDIRAFADEQGIDYKTKAGKLEATEEYIVSLAKSEKDSPLLDKFIALLREWARSMGFDLKISNAELRVIVAQAGAVMMKEEGRVRPTFEPILAARFSEAAEAGAEGSRQVELARKQWVEKGVESPFFKKWFGGSKVVDSGGKPLVVYHGTDKDFSAFDMEKTGAKDQGFFGDGIYLTADPETASAYSQYDGEVGSNVMPVYASLKNPYYWKQNDPAMNTREGAQELTRILTAQGYDGIIFDMPENEVWGDAIPFHEIVVFSPEQIKSATGNRGTFDTKNPDIRFNAQGVPVAWYSKLEKHIDEKTKSLKGDKPVPASHFEGLLKDMKKDEIEATSIREFLEEHPTVSKEEVLDYLRENQIGLNDEMLGVEADKGRITALNNEYGMATRRQRELAKADQESYEEFDALTKRKEEIKKELDKSVEQPTHFSQYVEPGAVPGSYREMFVTAPDGFEHTIEPHPDGKGFAIRRPDGTLIVAGPDRARPGEPLMWDTEEMARKYGIPAHEKTGWRDGHTEYSSIQNPVVRIRFNEREANGKRTLFIEEMQGPSNENQQKMPEFLQKRIYDIGVKRILSYAKVNGFDAVAWTPGAVQADRYDLSKHINKITYQDNQSGGATKANLDGPPSFGEIRAYNHKGELVLNKFVDPEDLPGIIGKEATAKLLKAEARQERVAGLGVRHKEISGLDLKVGGEGLKTLYDKTLPAMFKKYGQENVTPTKITTSDTTWKTPHVYEGPTYTVDQLKDALKVTDAGGRDIMESPFTGEKQSSGVNRAANSSSLRSMIKNMNEGMTFNEAANLHMSGAMADLFGGEMVPVESSMEVQSISITDRTPSSMPLFNRTNDGQMDDPATRFSRVSSKNEPLNTVTAYKLFRIDPKQPGKLFPLFVNANQAVPVGEWVKAEVGPLTDAGKVKSKLGPLAYRPGWHAGDLPIATHIGGKSSADAKAPDYRPNNQVWAEIEMPDDVDWQTEANKRGTNAAGKLVAVKAHITDQLPEGGHYRYKTNPNMTGNWLIGGSIKVTRVLTDSEVIAINTEAGVKDLPRQSPLADGLVKKLNGGEKASDTRFSRVSTAQASSQRLADTISKASSTPEAFKRWLENFGSFVVNKIFPVDRAIRLAQSSPWAFPIKQYLTELQDLKKSKGKYPEARLNDAAIHAKEFVKSIKNDEQLKLVENAIWKATLYQLDPFSDLDRQWQDGEWKAVDNEEFAPAKTLAAAKADLKQAWAKLTTEQKASVKVLTDHMKSIREDHKKALLESLRYAYGIDTEAFQKKADEIEEQFAKVIRGLYMPLIRTGEFMVRTSRIENGEIGKLIEAKKFKREHQAIAYIRAMTEKGYHTTLDRDMEVIGRNYTNVPAGFMADIEKKAKDRGLEGEALENFVSDMKKLWVDTLSPNSLEGNKLHRKGVAGFDTDIVKSYGTYVSKESLAVANAQYGWRIADKYREMYRTIDDLQEPGNNTDPHDISLMLNLLHGLEASDMKRKREKIPGWVQTAQKITFMAMLSSPSTWAVQWSQPFVFTIPKMGARFGMPRATAEYLKAAKEYMSGRYADKKIDEWNRLHGKVGERVVELIERHRVLESEMRQQIDSANRTFSTQFTAEKARGASEAELKSLRFKAEQDLARLTADLTRATKTEKEAIEKELRTTYGSLDALGKKYLVLRVSALLGGTELSLSHDMHDIVVGADKADSIFNKMVELSGFFMRKSETGSRKAAAVSAFGLAYNGDFIKAMDYTLKDIIDDTLNNFSTENRPELLSGPAGRLLFQFQFFRFHAIGKIVQLAKDSWGREYADTMQRVWKDVADKGYVISAVSDNGATVYKFTKDGKVFDSKMQRDKLPAELQKFLTTTEEAKAARRQARREFAFGMGVSFALAGAGGVPIAMLFTNTVTQLLWSALAFMFEDPDDPWDLGRDFSAGLHSVIGDTAANVVEKGIPSLFGMDISKRIGMGGMANIVQGDPPPGMTASQRTSWYANRLLGPTWSLIGDAAKAQEALANGELGKAAQYSSPKVIKDLFKTADLATNGVTTTSGKRLLQPEDINIYSVALMLVGVNPLDVSLAREEARELGNLSVTLSQRRSRLLKDYAKAVVSDDYDARESALEKINSWAESQPRLKISYQEMATATKRALDNRAGGKLSKKEQIIKEEYGL